MSLDITPTVEMLIPVRAENSEDCFQQYVLLEPDPIGIKPLCVENYSLESSGKMREHHQASNGEGATNHRSSQRGSTRICKDEPRERLGKGRSASKSPHGAE